MSRCIYRIIGMAAIMLGCFLFISIAKAEYGDPAIEARMAIGRIERALMAIAKSNSPGPK